MQVNKKLLTVNLYLVHKVMNSFFGAVRTTETEGFFKIAGLFTFCLLAWADT